jgi:outer membrane protein TolC
MSALGVGLVQDFPFPGKLARKSKFAESKARTVAEKERLVKALVIHDLKKAYWNLHFAEKAHAITKENIKMIDVLADVAINRVKVAKVAQQDAFQAQVAHSKLRTKIIQRSEFLINAKRNLNEAIGRNPESKVGTTENPLTADIELYFTVLNDEIRKESPYLKVAEFKVREGKSSLSEARYDRFPNFKLGVDYKLRDPVPGDMTNGADMVSVMVGITIPIWMGNKQNARVSENIHKLNAFKQQQRNIDLQIGTRLGILNEKISSLNNQIQLYQKEVLPRANKALSASITDYKRARVGFVSVVRNWNTELDLQINYEELLKERVISVSEIELITGTSLRRLGL